MVTETMILLAVRQKNWSHVAQSARQLADKNRWYQFLGDAAKKAASGDLRAAVLLSMWAELKWRTKR